MPSICASIFIYLPKSSSPEETNADLKMRKVGNEPSRTGRPSKNHRVREPGKMGKANANKDKD